MASLRIPAALLLVAVATLLPVGGAPPRFELHFDPADALVNLALFIPLGAALHRAGWARGRVLAAALLLSTLVELTQGTWIVGRRGNPIDLLFNVTGAGLGMWLPGAPAAALVIPLLAWLASGPAMGPCGARSQQWWGQWSHHFAGTVPYPGRILAVTFAGSPAPDGPLDSTQVLASRAHRDGWALAIDLEGGPPTRGTAHLAGVSDGEGNTLIAFEQRGGELLLSWRSRGGCVGLRTARWAVPGGLPESRGSPIHLDARVHGSRAAVTVTGPGGTDAHRLWLGPWTGWRSLIALPESTPARELGFTIIWGVAGLGLLAALVRRIPRPPRHP